MQNQVRLILGSRLRSSHFAPRYIAVRLCDTFDNVPRFSYIFLCPINCSLNTEVREYDCILIFLYVVL
jgi:hypothetical protein